jgi:2-C-methyl-D-erythritol 4-phosphate cytidylyltransferase
MWKEKELLNAFQITLNSRVRVVLSKQGAEKLRKASSYEQNLVYEGRAFQCSVEDDILVSKLWRLCAVFGEKGTRPFKKMEVLDEIVWEDPDPNDAALWLAA